MCGIVGIAWNTEKAPWSTQWIETSLHTLHQRGPMGSDTIQTENYCAGHSHLPLHPSGSAMQPCLSRCGRFVVNFNGEIYNYKELVHTLSISDAYFLNPLKNEIELIVGLYRKFGIYFLKKIRGMFAIAIFDKDSGSLILAKDFIGKKPLYYKSTNDYIAYSSELTCLMNLSERNYISMASLLRYFHINAAPTTDSMINNIDKVPPGCALVFKNGRKVIFKYWSIHDRNLRYECADIQALEGLLHSAVAKRVHVARSSDVGLLLSGGIDSGLVSAVAANLGLCLHCYTAGFPDHDFDESGVAKFAASRYGHEHSIIEIEDKVFMQEAEFLLERIDEPIADPSLIPLSVVCRNASIEHRVLLSGDGADDIFMGYAFYRAVLLIKFGEKLPTWLKEVILATANALPVNEKNLGLASIARMLARSLWAPPEYSHLFATSAFMAGEIEALLPDVQLPKRNLFEQNVESNGVDIFQKTRLGMIETFLQSKILPRADRASMAHGVEVRSPYLDQDLVEFALSGPSDRHYSNGKTKMPLRELAKQYLSRSIIEAPKSGFRAPLTRLLRGNMRDLVCDTLRQTHHVQSDLFSRSEIDRLINEHQKGITEHTKKIWSLFCLYKWLDGQRRRKIDIRLDRAKEGV